uniref:Lysosomal-trafficking regulator n=2 Tax=Parascaris univalens TaxID=6257 RepID=A0A914ZSZ0_PARUN
REGCTLMALKDDDMPQPDKLGGWHLRLLGCLALQLSHNDPSSHRTSLLLSLVARLHLNPTHGNTSHVRIICDSLNEFLRSAMLSELICETHKSALLHRLSSLECTPFTALSYKDVEDDCEDDARLSATHRKDINVFFSEYILHEDSDGFSVTLKDHPPTPSGDCYDLDDATLYILHDMCIGHVPETYSLFESAAYSLSILPRISNFAADNQFPDIIRNFIETPMPGINDVNEFANWAVLASLVVRGAFVSAESEVRIEEHPKSLPLLIEFTITFAKHIADSTNYALEGDIQTLNVDSSIADLHCAHVKLLFRCLRWVLDATSLSLSLSVDFERKLLVCLDALSLLVRYQFIETLRDACAIAGEIFSTNDGFRSFLDSFTKLYQMLFETTIRAQMSKSRDGNVKKVEHISHSSIPRLESGICPFAYLYQLASEMVANCSSTNMLEMVTQRIAQFPSGFCTCVSAISILSSLVVEPCIDQCSESILDALIIHLIQSESKCAANTSSTQLIDLFVKKLRNANLLNVNYILRVLSVASPYLSNADAELLHESLISRYLQLQDNNACEGFHSENSAHANQILLFLSANIVGQRTAASITEEILIPFIKRMDDCTDDFSHLFPLFNMVLISSPVFASYIEQLLLALCSRMERDLSVARSDIWTLISASEFSMPLLSIVDLINAFLSRYELSVLPETLVRCLRGCSGVFLDVCLDWIQAPSGDFSHMRRIGELLALSLAVVLSCEKKSSMGQFMEQLEKDTMSSMQNPISFRLLYCLVSALFDSSMMPVVIRQYDRDCPQCQGLFTVAEHESTECRAVSHPAMCLMGIRLLTDGVKRCPQLKEYDEYCVKRLCGRIRTICLMSRANLEALLAVKVIPSWLLLIENLIASSVSVGCFAAVLSIYSGLISLDAQPSHLKALIKLIRKAPHLQLSALEALLDVLRTNVVEPTECLAFPQDALGEIPFDMGESKMMTADSEKETSRSSRSFELMPTKLTSSLPSTFSLLSTLERFFSPGKDESKNATQKPTNEGAQKETNKPVGVLDRQVVERVVEDAFAAELSLGSPLNVFLSDGIGVSFWLRVDHPRNATKMADERHYVPVCSLGSADYSFSLMLSSNGENVRIVSTLHGRQIMRKRLRHSIALRQWTHVVMSLIVEHNTSSLNVTLNGHSTNLSGECRCPSDISSTPLLFSFGALKIPSRQTAVCFEMSTIFAFKGPISEQHALVLRALGCGCCSLAETPSSNLYVSLIGFITASRAQTAAVSLLTLLADTKKEMARLQRAFLFVIRSSSAHSFGVSVLQPGVDAQAAVIEGGGSILGLTMLKDYPIYWRCRVAQRQISSIEHSLIPLGSVQLVLLLFAQTVDMHSECTVQSTAFRLLMTFARRTSTSMGEFLRSSGYAVIARCLSSPLASINTPIVNEILRWSISELEEQESDVAKPTPSSIIVDPDLICSLVCCADIWRGESRFIHWLHLAEALAVCLSDTFARCFAFNRGQLIRVGFLTELFNTCNEMLQNANDFRMEPNNAVRLVKSLTIAISCLLGSPESTEAVTFLWHFILLSHPAADAFLQYQVHGHNDWIKNEPLKELRIDVIGGHSALAMRLNDYVRVLGAGRIADAWTRQRSLMALRHAYEAAVGMDPSRTHDVQLGSGRPSSDPQSCSVLPDLVKGIEARAITEEENVTVEELGDERSQSSVKFSGDPQAEWISALRCGAIELLSVVIQNGPDSLILALLHDAISWQSIIVLLSNQDDISFRNSVFILLENVLLRSPSSVRASFVKNHGFAILANHIRGHTITSSIANALFALLCGETVRLDEGLDSDHLHSAYVDNFTCSSFEAILVMWEECVTAADLSLFWNVTSALLKVYEANSLLMQAMMDAHLCDALANVLRRIALLPPLETDIESVSAWSPLLECWSSLAKRVIITCVPYNDEHHYEMCQRLIWLLEYELLAFSSNNVNDGYAGNVVRKELCSLLSCWLLTLQNVYIDEGLSASAAPSTESISSQSPAFAFRDEHIEDIESEGIPSSLASSLQGVSPMASFFTESFTNLRERISSIGDQMKCRYRWRRRMELPSPNESTNRVLFCIEACANLFTAIPSSSAEIISEPEEAIFQYFISFLLSTWKKDHDVIAMRCGASSRAQAWAHLLSACRDRARLLLGQLIAFVLFPAEHKISARMSSTCSAPAFERSRWSIRKRFALVHSLANDLPYKNTLKTLLDIKLDYQYAMNLTLHELALVDNCLDEDSARDVEKLVRFLRNLQIESPLANLTPERIMSLTTDETLALHEYVDHRNGFMLALCERVTALYEEERRASEPVSNTAMSLTCEVVEEQNLSRKLFLRSCHRAETSSIYAERIISSLSAQLCHPEAVCFDESSWPLSWALDPTEGPNRERRRLKADHLNFDKRFVLPEFAKNLDNRERPFPLANLLSGRRTSPKGWSMMETLADDERIRVSLPAKVVRSTVESSGEVLLGDVKFYFFGDNTRSTQKGVSQATVMIVVWEYSAVVEVYKRHHLLKDVAIEIFLSDGQTYLIVFEEQTNRDHFMSQLLSMDLCNLVSSPQNLHSITQIWREGGMSNFEYLMQLNKLAGRSFNDLMQYPVFPFVLSNYSSSVIDLADASSYRNLSKPMAIQNKRMEGHYLGVYACLAAETKRLSRTQNSPTTTLI